MISIKISTKVIQIDLLGVVVKYVVVQFLQKKKKKSVCCDENLPCFVSFYFPKSCMVIVAYNKTNIPCLFLFDIKIIHPQ